MKRFNQQFTVHPVGQGFFYSGVFTTELFPVSRDFKFVFDCGSLTHADGNEEADLFRDSHLPGTDSKLDLLVISHFDADHINKIGRLLKDKRKLDNLVMPFTLLRERLFMGLRYAGNADTENEDDFDFTLSMMIDPLGTLSGNLGEGGNVFLMTTDPDNPPFGVGDNENVFPEANIEDPETAFDFPAGKKDLSTDEIKASGLRTEVGTVKTVQDSFRAKLFFKHRKEITLAEFLFYHKPLGENEKNFYDAVYSEFCNKYKIDPDAAPDEILDQMIRVIKPMKGSTKIKELFIQAAKKIKLDLNKSEIANMNSTALNMLHVNLPVITGIFGQRDLRLRNITTGISEIKKMGEIARFRFEVPVITDIYWKYWHWVETLLVEKKYFCYPNVLLTSDAYLIEQTDSDRFCNRYKNYWEHFWLFQVPHHGSKNNINKSLLSRIKLKDFVFLNYGIRHQFEKKYLHPDNEVIADLVSTGHSKNILAVNEYSGLKFFFECRNDA